MNTIFLICLFINQSDAYQKLIPEDAKPDLKTEEKIRKIMSSKKQIGIGKFLLNSNPDSERKYGQVVYAVFTLQQTINRSTAIVSITIPRQNGGTYSRWFIVEGIPATDVTLQERRSSIRGVFALINQATYPTFFATKTVDVWQYLDPDRQTQTSQNQK